MSGASAQGSSCSQDIPIQGNFAEVRNTLERCLEMLRPQDSNRFQVITGLAGVYCDLDLAEKLLKRWHLKLKSKKIKGVEGSRIGAY